MARIQIKNKKTGEIEYITQEAIETPVRDLVGNFSSKNLETVLQEIGLKLKNGVATPDDVALLKAMINNLSETVGNLQPGSGSIEGVDIDTLKELIQKYENGELGNGGTSSGIEGINTNTLKEMVNKYENGELSGGGSGAVSPTIESTFPSESVIEEGSSVTIDIYFQTPNLGEGTAYISINNIEIDQYPTITQGDNNIKIDSKYLTKTNNTISIYVKDRVLMTSNKLTFKVISGGVSLTTTFDYTVDYVVGQNILFPFYTTTELSGEITLEVVIDGIPLEPMVCANGYNSFYLNRYITSVGVHAVRMQAFVGTYHSKVLNFNVVISSSTQLILSTDLLEDSQFEYGNPIQMAYRISKLGSEVFTVEFYIDDILKRTSKVQTGNYYWTISGAEMNIGRHKLDIIAYGANDDRASVSVNIEIVAGEFTPIENVSQGIVCFLDSDGYSNEQQNKEIWLDKSGNGHNGELINFNFSTNGWNPIIAEVDDKGNEVLTKYNGLVCNNDAYVKIPYKPFLENVINGYTMEIVYTPEHSGNDLARVLEYVDHDSPYTGIFVDINEANIKSESETSMGTVDLDYESGEIQLDFVIDRENKMCRMYVNGIVSRYWMLSDSGNKMENFAIDTDYIYINFSGLSQEYCGGTNVVRKFICYERALTHEEVVQNLIANQPDLTSMQQMYKWNYETQIPKLYVYGDISKCSTTNPSYVRVKFESPDTSLYGESFDMESSNTPFYLQGTSSLGYSRKNYRFVLMDSNGKEFFHALSPNVLSESTFTLKCDYVDSSMTSNVCLAQIANDAVYGKGFTPAQKDNADRRTAIYGHAIELINVVDNEQESLGAYMFNIDRYATKNMGYDIKQYPNMLCIEGESNSDVGSSAFFSYSNPQSSGSQFPNEIAYHNEGWRVVYPTTNEDAWDFAPVKRLVDFVDLSSDDDFKDSFEQYFNKDSILRYYLFDMFIGGIDGLSKNFHLCSWDGQIFYCLPYDLDSCLGGTNTGYLRVPPSCEVGVLYDTDGTTVLEENHFNSWNSKLWARVRNTFRVDLNQMYTTLRSNGLFTLENMLSYFEKVWEIIPPKMYNESQQIKYINDGATGMVALHGNRKLQIKKWLRERIAYLDSKFEYYAGGGVNEEYVNFRMNYQGAVSLDISTYYTVYAKVRWASKNEQIIRIAKGQKKTFSYYSDVGTDREVMVMLPESLKTIENISNIHPNSIDISKATKLTQIEAHNPNLFSVDLSKNKYLRKVDFNGCTSLGTETATMSLNYCKYLNKVDLRGTKITAVTFNTKGGSLREIYYPTTIQSINLINQGLLTDMILPYGEDGSKVPVDLATINIENCPNIQKLIDLTSNPTSLDGMKYCRNMTINNSIKLSTINFNGFTRLANVNLQNIETLEAVDFLNLTKKGETSSLRYIGVSACPKLTTISMNVNDPNYEITWADEGILDLQTSGAVRNIESNCVIKGLTTIILPQTIESLYFTTEYGSGYADVVNIWSAEASSVTKTGVFPVAYHLNSENVTDEYVGIDFRGLSLKNIDLGGLVNIPDAINFSLSPTNVNPNFNLHRNGDTLPYLQPKGTLDLSNYTGSLAKFFNGVDLDVLQVTSKNTLPQTDYSYCFFNSIFTSMDSINPLLEKIDEVFNASHMFDSTIIDNTSLLETLVWKRGAIIDYMFANTKIENLDDLALPSFVGSAIGTFSRCKLLTTAKNMMITINGSVAHFLEDCPKLTSIEGSMLKNVTSIAYLLANDRRVNVGNIFMSWELNKCSDMSYAFSGTSINNSTFDLNTIILGTSNCKYDYIFNGAMDLHIKLTGATVNINNIEGFTKGVINSILDISGMDLSARSNFTSAFENQEINEIILTDVVWGNDLIFDKAFKATRIEEDFLLPLTTISCAECFSNIPTLISIHSNWKQIYKRTIVPNNCYSGNSNLLNLDGVVVKNEYVDVLDEAPEIWGGTGFSKDYTGIYEVIIPSDNYTFSLGGYLSSYCGTKPVSKLLMGDGGVIDKLGAGTSYTYAKAGTYVIKGHFATGGGKGIGQIAWVLSKVIQYPNVSDNFDVGGSKNLTYVDCANITRPLRGFTCNGCTSLTTLDNSTNLDFSNCSHMTYAFQNCYYLKFDYPNGKPNWKFKTDGNIALAGAFLNCGSKLDLSIDEEYVFDLSECGQVKCTNYLNVFNNSAFTKLIVNVDTYRDVDSADHRSSFSSPKLKELSFTEGSIWGSDMRNTFNIPNATTIDLSNLDISHTVYGAESAFNNLPNVVDLKFGKGWQHSTSFSNDKKLSRESLLSIINNLEVVSGQTLTLGSVNLAKLTDDDIAIATNKGWSVV